MWRRHSEYRRVWFENPQKVYVYHDVVDSKWYVEDGEGNRLYAHKDEHKKEDGSMYGDPATELPPETGYLAVEGKSPGPQFSFHAHEEERMEKETDNDFKFSLLETKEKELAQSKALILALVPAVH